MPMARKKPRTSRANGKTFRIRYCDPGTVKGDDGTVCRGTTDFERQEIDIERLLPPDIEGETLLHEHLHQLIEPLANVLPDDLEEVICKALGIALFASLRESPELWRYVLSIASPRPRRPRVVKSLLTGGGLG